MKGRANEVKLTHKMNVFTSDRGISRVRAYLGRVRGEKSPYTNNSSIERSVVPFLDAQRTSQTREGGVFVVDQEDKACTRILSLDAS